MTDQDNNAGDIEKQDQAELNKDELKQLCQQNGDYFSKDSSENGQRLYISFLSIIDSLDSIWPKVIRIQKQAGAFDFDENTPGNGYRSFLKIVNATISLSIELNQKIALRRSSVLFRKGITTKEIESCSHLIASLDSCLSHLETMLTWSSPGNLFPDQKHSPEELFAMTEDVNQYCFYGRHMGFQYCESLRHILQFISLSMAIFSEAYYSQGSLILVATNSLMSTTKYLTDPEHRARRIVNIAKNASVDFCKAFWFLSESELMNQLPSVVSPRVAVCQVIQLPPEPLSIQMESTEIPIPVPTAYIGKKTLQVRLISDVVRQGMIGANKSNNPPARGLILHCHGGGFVAQSSKSHESYLKDWARQVKVPILSVDYSLAPEAPYPRALQEVTYAYGWVLKNHALLGSTGERIVFVGDSAGANLLLSTTLKAINMGLPKPNGVFSIYSPTLVNLVPSPARLLCLMDPLLPFGFLIRCLKAYAVADLSKLEADNSDTESFEEISESDLQELQAHKSPVSDTSDTLTYGSFTSVDEDKIGTDREINSNDIEQSQKYVSDFLEKYVLDSDTETDGTKVAVLREESTASSLTPDSSLQNRVSSFVTNLKSKFTKFVVQKKQSSAERILDVDREENLYEEFKFSVPKDPYLSPLYADDNILKQFPKTKVLTVHLDPCLDDCVMFAKRLKNLNHDVHLDILEGLPHGFLNFSLISKDAFEGSKLCVERIMELLDLESLPPSNFEDPPKQ